MSPLSTVQAEAEWVCLLSMTSVQRHLQGHILDMLNALDLSGVPPSVAASQWLLRMCSVGAVLQCPCPCRL